MCCLALIAGFIGPRVALFIWWVFGSKVDAAFDSWVWPLLGLVFLPWTTLAYITTYIGGIDGFDWVIIGLAVVLDIVNIGGGAYGNRRRLGYDNY